MKRVFTQSKWIEILRQGKSIYNFAELIRLSGLSVSSLRRAIHRLIQRGLLIKLSKGLYANSFACPSLEEVAGILYPPSYISLESALFLHGILDQIPHLVTCVSLNKTKTFHTTIGEIAYFHIKKDLYFGYQIKDGVPIALPEKAALDFIYHQRQNGLEPILDEWNWDNLNLNKINYLIESYPKTVQKDVAKHISPSLTVANNKLLVSE
ncbi:MAG: type IV toxin-antitoxin system AbiEi family antitoxin domain-containing protein [Candidatus Marinimicrobia bacterium]|nr:type IV toxin-antitoxin system AbiEi family antitoxin domain-containing protein [Candidatus Neomarinimicrobiota bacterium]MCK4445825.1 type IV toxin-antitoxin system AbiEi family antitoxin domain-containing protein [Candidatus Neomarinimicrobiota bacterium]